MPKEALPTQQLVEIETVQEGTVILKNGSLRKILMVAGIKFDLKSEEEQGFITFSYQNFINSLNFSVQIFIHSRKLNIGGYLNNLELRLPAETNELLKNQIKEYTEFVRSFVADNPIMEKVFFVVVPLDPIQIPAAGIKITQKITRIFSKKQTAPSSEEEKQELFHKNIRQLNQRVDQVTSGLTQIGLSAAPLNDEQLIELFYNLYNPEAVEKRTLEIAKTK